MSAGSQRIDKWLFFARLTKTRGLAQDLVGAGHVRLNREKIDQPAKPVRPGDVLTLSLNGRVRVLKVRSAGLRRGPASEAAELYEDLSAPRPPAEPTASDETRTRDGPSRP